MFGLVEKFAPPIYTAFFVLAGAHMEFGAVGIWTVVLIGGYTVMRAAGKIWGSWLGARYSRAPRRVQKYLGICLLPQAGVAIGLAILAGKQFDAEVGRTIIMIVMTATFLMEIFGPVMVKAGVKKAGEVGMNVTEEDLIKSYKVKDMMDTKPAIIRQDVLLDDILEVFSESDSVYYPVVDDKLRILGVITIADIKEMFANRDVAAWLLAIDVAEPVVDKTAPETPLEEAIDHMGRYHLEHLPVVLADKGGDRLAGVLDHRKALRKISAEVLRRRKRADEMAEIPAQNRGR
jgi:CBS domain-containing protein